MSEISILTPAGYAPAGAVGFASSGGKYVLTSKEDPLPVTLRQADANPALAGLSHSSEVVGPWVPSLGRPVIISLSGEWAGHVRVMRSTDDGATLLPITASGEAWATFTSNVCEAVWEEVETSAALYLDMSITSGSVIYRVGN